MTLRRLATVVALLLLGPAAAGCGGDNGLPRSAAAALQPEVAAIRTAAAGGDRAAAAAATAHLRQVVAQLRATDGITARQASDVLDAAGGVAAQLALLPPPLPEDPAPTITVGTGPDDDHPRRGKGKDGGKDE